MWRRIHVIVQSDWRRSWLTCMSCTQPITGIFKLPIFTLTFDLYHWKQYCLFSRHKQTFLLSLIKIHSKLFNVYHVRNVIATFVEWNLWLSTYKINRDIPFVMSFKFIMAVVRILFKCQNLKKPMKPYCIMRCVEIFTFFLFCLIKRRDCLACYSTRQSSC